MVFNKRWNKYTYDEQCDILRDLWCSEQMSIIGEVCDEYIFEKTKKGNAHLHAIVYSCDEKALQIIQKSIHERYGYKKDPLDRIFNYSKTMKHERFWKAYMMKEQNQTDPDYIPYKPFPSLISL